MRERKIAEPATGAGSAGLGALFDDSAQRFWLFAAKESGALQETERAGIDGWRRAFEVDIDNSCATRCYD